jgi:hypothetical protein
LICKDLAIDLQKISNLTGKEKVPERSFSQYFESGAERPAHRLPSDETSSSGEAQSEDSRQAQPKESARRPSTEVAA